MSYTKTMKLYHPIMFKSCSCELAKLYYTLDLTQSDYPLRPVYGQASLQIQVKILNCWPINVKLSFWYTKLDTSWKWKMDYSISFKIISKLKVNFESGYKCIYMFKGMVWYWVSSSQVRCQFVKKECNTRVVPEVRRLCP